MTAAQEGQVIPSASAVTTLTCANNGLPRKIIKIGINQIPVRRFIPKSFLQLISILEKKISAVAKP